MNIYEALKLLDTDVKEGSYSKQIIKSEKRNLWLVNSHYGLCRCTSDWPNSYTINELDIEADDWELDDK